jgi:phospholipid/cholesterol/gamma-HCH transport system permease protein
MAAAPTQLSVSRIGDSTLLLHPSLNWTLDRNMPSGAMVQREIGAGGVKRVAFDVSALASWDSSLITFLIAVSDLCRASHIELDPSALPPGAQKLLALAQAVAEEEGTRAEEQRPGLLASTGIVAIQYARSAKEFVSFVGQSQLLFSKLYAAGRAIAGLTWSRLFGPVALVHFRS